MNHMNICKSLVICLSLCLVVLGCNTEELEHLQNAAKEQTDAIASLNQQVDSIKATIVDLKEVDMEIGLAIDALRDFDTTILAQLTADKAAIEARIDTLETYVNEQLQDAKDWVQATFATLEQYEDLCNSVAIVKQNLADLEIQLTTKLKNSIDSLETSMKAWVNEQLTGYYTIAQMDAKLAVLAQAIQDGDQANADAIAQLQSDLQQQATTLTAAYQAAIASAIEESNGIMTQRIETEIATVNTRITNEVKAISDRMDALELRIKAVEDYINSQKNFTISFSVPEDGVCFPGQTIKVGYTISESTLPTTIECIPDAGWKATVQSNGNTGTISITAPAEGGDGKVIVLANRSTWTLVSTISLDGGVLYVANDEYPAPAEGGRLDIPFSINAGYGIKIAPANASWISVIPPTKSALSNEVLSLDITANPNQSIRVGKVYIYPKDGNSDEYYELKINQASAYFSVSTTGFVVGGDVTSKEVTVTSSLPFKISIPAEADWISAESVLLEGTTYKITASMTANNGGVRRTTDISFISNDGATTYGSIAVVQDTRSEEDISAMIFEVRANVANDYTVYLPIYAIDNTSLDCYIDWGDGTCNHYHRSSYFDDKVYCVSHRYAGLDAPTTFNVKVTGYVPCLYAAGVNVSDRGTITGIRQWGKTNLKVLDMAFEGFTHLQSIPTDETKAFENVSSMQGVFSGCVSLESIPTGLFDNAINTTALNGVFSQCASITDIPDGLFNNCTKVTTFEGAFSGTSITSIPERLFWGCTEVIAMNSVFAGCENLVVVPELLFRDCHNVTSFAHAFRGCTSLSSIPEKLFSFCPKVESFQSTFWNSNLSKIPVSLFDNNRRVVNFEGCFYYGVNGGESPYTIINGVKYHLYERVNNVDEFVAPSSYARCFYCCGGLSDSESIPSSWK